MSYERAKQRAGARHAALVALAARHEDEFARLYAEALKAAGIDCGGSPVAVPETAATTGEAA